MFALSVSSRIRLPAIVGRLLALPVLVAAVLLLGVTVGCGVTPNGNGGEVEPVQGAESLPSSTSDRGRGRGNPGSNRGGADGPTSENGDEGDEDDEDGGVGGLGGLGDLGDLGRGGSLAPMIEALGAEMAEIQSQLVDLQVKIGDLENFENTVRTELEKSETGLAALDSTVTDTAARLDTAEKELRAIGRLEGEITDLRGLRKKHKDEHVELDDQVGKIPLLEEEIGKLSDLVDNNREDMGFLRTGKADGSHLHDDHYLKISDWNHWTANDYKAPQSRLWIVAVAGLSALLTAALALYMALKAIRPAYTALNDFRLKINQMVGKGRRGDEGEA